MRDVVGGVQHACPRSPLGTRALAAGVALLLLGALAPAAPAAGSAGSAGLVYLSTVPALAGVRLDVGGAVVTTGRYGRAAVHVADLDGIAKRVSLASARLNGRTTVALSHIDPAPHTTPHVSRLSIGLSVRSAVRLSVSTGRSGVPSSTVSALRLHSITGQVLTVHPRSGSEVTLAARRAMLQHGTLRVQAITWSVDRVTTTTGVAVTTKGPRFDPLGRSRWAVRLAPVAGRVQVVTLPATADVTFRLGGSTLTTNSHGVATTPVGDLNNVASKVDLLTPRAGRLDVSLLRVTKLPPGAVHQRRVLASLLVRRPVQLRFVDPAGKPVPSSRVSWVRLNGDGRAIRIPGRRLDRPVMLPAAAAEQVHSNWRTRAITYSVTTARVDGANAVFSGRQRFDPNRTGTWPVRLSVFRLSLTVRDSLFGRRTSSQVTVTLPDGTSRHLYAGTGRPIVLPALVRGIYRVDIGAAVIGSKNSVLVSRDGTADFRVVTMLDTLVIILVLAVLVVVLIAAGRAMASRNARQQAQESP
ncbi:MAG TPA: hypothetical protein VFI30_06010 [Nocardioidaceae bacterium]|nr:hypothetical protein [Nocardioidaceae bacterium]